MRDRRRSHALQRRSAAAWLQPQPTAFRRSAATPSPHALQQLLAQPASASSASGSTKVRSGGKLARRYWIDTERDRRVFSGFILHRLGRHENLFSLDPLFHSFGTWSSIFNNSSETCGIGGCASSRNGSGSCCEVTAGCTASDGCNSSRTGRCSRASITVTRGSGRLSRLCESLPPRDSPPLRCRDSVSPGSTKPPFGPAIQRRLDQRRGLRCHNEEHIRWCRRCMRTRFASGAPLSPRRYFDNDSPGKNKRLGLGLVRWQRIRLPNGLTRSSPPDRSKRSRPPSGTISTVSCARRDHHAHVIHAAHDLRVRRTLFATRLTHRRSCRHFWQHFARIELPDSAAHPHHPPRPRRRPRRPRQRPAPISPRSAFAYIAASCDSTSTASKSSLATTRVSSVTVRASRDELHRPGRPSPCEPRLRSPVPSPDSGRAPRPFSPRPPSLRPFFRTRYDFATFNRLTRRLRIAPRRTIATLSVPRPPPLPSR